MGTGIEWRRGKKKCWVREVSLAVFPLWRAGLFSKHTLELRFKRQIFMIFIVDYFCKKGFLKIEKNLIRGQSF